MSCDAVLVFYRTDESNDRYKSRRRGLSHLIYLLPTHDPATSCNRRIIGSPCVDRYQNEMSNSVTGQPLDRRPSRLSGALTHVRSIDAHPPPHAHARFDEQPETQTNIHEPLPPHVPEGKEGSKQGKSVVDIEHVPVDDDPREWSNLKKNLVLTMMTISVVCFLPPSIPVIEESERLMR